MFSFSHPHKGITNSGKLFLNNPSPCRARDTVFHLDGNSECSNTLAIPLWPMDSPCSHLLASLAGEQPGAQPLRWLRSQAAGSLAACDRYRLQKSAACFAHGLALTHTELVFALLAVSTGVKSNAVKNTAPQSRPQPQPQKERVRANISAAIKRHVWKCAGAVALLFQYAWKLFCRNVRVESKYPNIFP